MSISADEPDEDFFQLAAGADIIFEIVSIAPAFKLYTPGFTVTLDAAGETWDLGATPIHEHPTWHIDADDPNYVPGQTLWQVTFRLTDQGPTGYSPSPDYTVLFTNVQKAMPATSTWGIVLAGLTIAALGMVFFRRSVAKRARSA
jgi:hypothetical protein